MSLSPLCFISARNLGDAVMHASFLKQLIEARSVQPSIVWTFPQARFLFEHLPNCQIISSDFPMGASMKSFLRGGWRGFGQAFWKIFKARPHLVVELVSDYRERLLSFCLLPTQRAFIHWRRGHPFRQHAYIPPWPGKASLSVAAHDPSIYAAYNRLFQTLTQSDAVVFTTHDIPGSSLDKHKTVGLHPFASAPFKLWPMQRWSALVKTLTAQSHSVVVFGAPSDMPQLEALAAVAPGRIEIFAQPLAAFMQRVASLDAMVGLDSFSVHMASSLGVPTVLLNGPNDPRVFSPLTSRVVTCPQVCPAQPCFGRPSCIGTGHEYVCMQSIEIHQVAQQIDKIFLPK
jgi:ADP-heptose:LPS heptosyltransferase